MNNIILTDLLNITFFTKIRLLERTFLKHNLRT